MCRPLSEYTSLKPDLAKPGREELLVFEWLSPVQARRTARDGGPFEEAVGAGVELSFLKCACCRVSHLGLQSSVSHLGGTIAIHPVPWLQMGNWRRGHEVTARDSQQEAGGAGTRVQVPFIVLVSGLRIFVGSSGGSVGKKRICSTCLSLYEICVLLGLRGAC